MIDSQLLINDKKKTDHLKYWMDLLSLRESRGTMVVKTFPLIEKVLISRLLAGDSMAFSCIFSVFFKDLVLFAIRYTHELIEAEEIVQDTFVKLWEDHESIKINSSLKSYLLRIVQNKCIDWCRHKKILDKYGTMIMETAVPFDNYTDNYLLQSELQDQIDNALEKLPKEIAEAFKMNRYKGLKYHEIAKIMSVSQRTIEVYIGKALATLRKYLKDYFLIIALPLLICL